MTTIKTDCSFFYFLLSKAVSFGGEGLWKQTDFHLNPELATSCLYDLCLNFSFPHLESGNGKTYELDYCEDQARSCRWVSLAYKHQSAVWIL